MPSTTKRLIVLLTSLSLLASTVTAQKPAPRLTIQDSWVRDYTPFRIAGNLYYVGSEELASYLITTPAGDILINTGAPGSDTLIRRHIEALGFHVGDVKILLTNQAHFDHMGGMAAIKKITGARFMVDEGDAEVVRDGGNSDFIFGGHGHLFEPVKAHRLLHDLDTIRLGGMEILILHHPGHTKGSCSFLFTVKDETRSYKVLIANIPTILDETTFPSMSTYPGVMKDYAYTLDTMPKLQFDIWFAAHAGQFGLLKKHHPGDPYNPMAFADRAGYDATIAEQQKVFIRRVSRANAQSSGPPTSRVKDPDTLSIPMLDGRVAWTQQFTLPAGPRQRELFRRLKDELPVENLTITTADPETGTILGTGGFTAPIRDSGKDYLLRFNWAITVRDSSYTFTLTHVYEKPVGLGTTSEYSKIEYRWWDFRHGHPWSGTDHLLFTILDMHMDHIMTFIYYMVNVPRWHVLALYENGGHHIEYSRRARVWLDQLASDSNFSIDYLTHPDSINDELLSHYQLFIQLDYPPYGWTPAARTAFQRYIEQGRGGWIGFHHASLLGEFDGYPMWGWFHDFMGGIRWKNYIARFADATVRVEDHSHPLMAGIPDSFTIDKEEWYTYDRSPRPAVHVLAHVDESTYDPDTTIRMGDHPVIWTNEHVRARNVYIFMGHSPALFDNPVYTRLFANAISWTASAPSRPKPAVEVEHPRFRALAFFSTNVEPDHVDFAYDAIRFYTGLAARDHFALDTTSNWDNCDSILKHYQVVLWLNEFPHNEVQRAGFESYMEHGGAWMGFHVSAYNDKDTHWPWFVDFLGGAVFYNNSWPPLPAKLIVDDTRHPATHRLPPHYTAPINEWYGWRPDPRTNKDVKVLVTLDTANFPLGKKDILRGGDIPVVWTNTRYRMLYLNMGHGDQNFASPVQDRLFEDAILWLGKKVPGVSR